MTLDEFDEMVEKFLATFGDADREEYYSTPVQRACEVMDELRGHLYSSELERAERHKEYLKLKAEFEPDGS